MDPQDRKESPVEMELRAIQDQQVALAVTVHVDRKERSDQSVTVVSMDHLVLLVLQELEVVLVNVDEKVKPVKFQ